MPVPSLSLDDRQKAIVKAWHDLSKGQSNALISFMAEWIAFNAICYGLYHERATRERADLNAKTDRLKAIRNVLSSPQVEGQPAVEASIKIESEALKVKVSVYDSQSSNLAHSIAFVVKKRYTEELIYEALVQAYSDWYRDPSMADLRTMFATLKHSLTKEVESENRHYVINMSRVSDLPKSVSKEDVDDLARKNIVVLCEHDELKQAIDVLYQVRCNTFHGEKIPGDLNDDRIVKAAAPLLSKIVEQLMKDHIR